MNKRKDKRIQGWMNEWMNACARSGIVGWPGGAMPAFWAPNNLSRID